MKDWKKGDILVRCKNDSYRSWSNNDYMVVFGRYNSIKNSNIFYPIDEILGNCSMYAVDCYTKLDKPIVKLLV